MRLAYASAVASLVAAFTVAGCSSSQHGSQSDTPASPPGPGADPATPPSAADQAVRAMSVEDLPEGDSYLANLPTLVTQLGLQPYYARGYHGQGLTGECLHLVHLSKR